MEPSRELFAVPDFCPTCGSPSVEDGDFLFCRSKACPSRLSGALKVWINRLGLLHWGDAVIDAIAGGETPAIQSVADVYRMSPEDLAPFTSGLKMARKLHDVLHSNKSVALELLLCGQNIHNLGMSTSTDIVQAGYDTLEKVLSITFDDLVKVPNVGEITARSILDGLEERRSVLLDLASILDVKKPVSGTMSGKSVCITGPTSIPRKAIQKMIIDAGGVAKDSVGSGLSCLVTNETTRTSKFVKAEKLKIPVLTESELYAMMGVSPPNP
jgi:DNA ligase (NAD+)